MIIFVDLNLIHARDLGRVRLQEQSLVSVVVVARDRASGFSAPDSKTTRPRDLDCHVASAPRRIGG
jgi:hypothetical protein